MKLYNSFVARVRSFARGGQVRSYGCRRDIARTMQQRRHRGSKRAHSATRRHSVQPTASRSATARPSRQHAATRKGLESLESL